METQNHNARTLWLCTALHGFTHVYQVALIPLYLLIRKDFSLTSDGQATFFVTAMGVSYFLPSYFMGILADHASRKKILAVGLTINAAGFIGLSFAPNYATAITCLVVAGFGGSFYHPAATALIARLFPINTGKALGKVGIGASLGFFVGPIYSGWRAETAGWRQPILELGIIGLLGAIAFVWLAVEHENPKPIARAEKKVRLFPTPLLWLLFLSASFAFCLRDFAGMGMATLSSLFLQRAHEFSLKQTGLTLSCIYLASVISNPLFGGLSDRSRVRWTSTVLIVAAAIIFIFPHLHGGWIPFALAAYGFFFMASYPMVEAALMQSVPDAVRGRVFGLFITIGGLLGNFSHWLIGTWTKKLGTHAMESSGYFNLYNVLALFVLLSLAGLFGLHSLRRKEGRENASPPFDPSTVSSPQFE
jgi:MFS family permease